MARKPSHIIFFFFLSITLAACAPNTTSSPTAEQDRLETSIAATVKAASIGTERAILTSLPTETPIAPQSPTQPERTLVPTVPTPKPSPTLLPSPESTLRVAYIKNSDVYLWSDGQKPIRLTDVHDAVRVRLSDDGELIAFKRQYPEDFTLQELWVLKTTGVPNPQLLVGASELADLLTPDAGSSILGVGVLDFNWRPETHNLTYNTVLLHEGPGFGPNYDLRLVNADTLEKTTLFSTGEGGIYYYSPDGNQIAFSNPGSISLVNADGSEFHSDVLTFPHVITYSEYEYTPHPIWAADGSRVCVAIPPHDPLADPLPPTDLWSIPADGSPASLLSSILAIPFVWPNNACAPDLEHVIYVTPVGDRSSNQDELRIISPDGSNEVTYDQGESLEFLAWSPDSFHFVYQIHAGDKKGIYLGSLNTQPKLVIFDPDVVQNIRWLGSKHLVFLIQDGNQWQLFFQDPSNGEFSLIDSIPDSNPDFDVLP